MLFNVPQFIDIEDKIVGPLTAKQLGWLALGGVILFPLWVMLDTSAFFMAALFVAGLSGALAFYRPHNQPLVTFIVSSASFLFRPKMYVWKRVPEKMIKVEKAPPKASQAVPAKTINQEKIREVSKILDQK